MQQILLEYRPSLFVPPRSCPYLIGKTTFVPGVRSYPLKEWEELKKEASLWSVVQTCLDMGVFRVISEIPTGATEDKGDSSDSDAIEYPSLPKNAVEALDIIKKTFSMTLLEYWKKTDTRKGVQEAIAEQMKKSEEPPPPPKDA